jgi:hypothetical protein
VRRMLDAYSTGHAWTPPGPAKESIWWCRFFVDGWWAALPPGAVLAHLLACRQDAPPARRTDAVPRPQATFDLIAGTLTARFGALSEAARGAVLPGPWTEERVADGLTRLAERADVTAVTSWVEMLDALVVVRVLTATDDSAPDGSRSVRCPGTPRREDMRPVVTSVWANPTGEEEGFAWAATMLPLLLTNAFLDRSARADVPALMVRVSTPTIELPGAREQWTFAEGDPAGKIAAWRTQLEHDALTLNAAWAPLAQVRLFDVPDVSIDMDNGGTSFGLPALDMRIDWDYVATIPGLLPPAELMCLLRADLLTTPAPDQVTRAGHGGPEQAALQAAGRNVATLLPGMWTNTVMAWVNTFQKHPDRLHRSLARSAVLDLAADAGVRGITWRDRALVTRRCEPLSYGPLEGVVDANPNRAVSRTNPLGMPLPGEPDSEVWDTIAERLGIGLEQWMDHLVDLVDSLAWDRAVVEAGGRWSDRLVARAANEPGDALALRTFAAEHLLARIDNWYEEMNWSKAFSDFTSIASMAPDLMAAAAMVAHAVPFYLPANIAVGIADSQPPDPQMLAELRLPYDLCLITLGAPLLIEPRSVSWHFDATTALARFTDAEIREAAHRHPAAPAAVLAAHRPTPAIPAMWALGILIDGVVVHANPAGGIHDEVVWLVRVPHPDDATRTLGRTAVLGRLSRSLLTDITHNLATALAASSWHTPTGDPTSVDLPSDPTSSEFRRRTRRGGFGAAERSGAAGRVRILDLHPADPLPGEPVPPAPPDFADDETAAPADPATDARHRATHLRRGHWRRTRTGPRGDWTYAPRWIRPVIVNAARQDWRGVAVYRVPEPDSTETRRGDDG